MAGTGSSAVDEVVPTVAHTNEGAPSLSAAIALANASGRMANDSSTSTNRGGSVSPATRAAFSTDEWAWFDV